MSKSPGTGKYFSSTGKTVKSQSPAVQEIIFRIQGKTVKPQSPPVQEIIFPVQGKTVKTQSLQYRALKAGAKKNVDQKILLQMKFEDIGKSPKNAHFLKAKIFQLI